MYLKKAIDVDIYLVMSYESKLSLRSDYVNIDPLDPNHRIRCHTTEQLGGYQCPRYLPQT